MVDLRDETLQRLQQFQDEYAAFILSLPDEEQEVLRKYNADVLIIERKDTRPLPVVIPMEELPELLPEPVENPVTLPEPEKKRGRPRKITTEQ